MLRFVPEVVSARFVLSQSAAAGFVSAAFAESLLLPQPAEGEGGQVGLAEGLKVTRESRGPVIEE